METDTFFPVQEIALAVKDVPPEFLVGDEVQETLRRSRRPEDEDQEHGLQIPVIDLRPLFDNATEESERVKREIGRACEDWGFFQVGLRSQATARHFVK